MAWEKTSQWGHIGSESQQEVGSDCCTLRSTPGAYFIWLGSTFSRATTSQITSLWFQHLGGWNRRIKSLNSPESTQQDLTFKQNNTAKKFQLMVKLWHLWGSMRCSSIKLQKDTDETRAWNGSFLHPFRTGKFQSEEVPRACEWGITRWSTGILGHWRSSAWYNSR